MYQVNAGWLLHDIPNALLEESGQITFRGYNRLYRE